MLRKTSANDGFRRLAAEGTVVLATALILLLSWPSSGLAQADRSDRTNQQPAAQPPPPLRGQANANAPPNQRPAEENGLLPALDADQMLSPEGLTSTLKIMLLLTVLSLAPSILVMTTCFIRFVVVFGLLRQALGTQQLPPNQIITSLSLFLTFLVMAPVWQQSYEQGIRPYTSAQAGEPAPSLEMAWEKTVAPLRAYMSAQIDRADNAESIWLFLDFQRPDPDSEAGRNYQPPEDYSEVPLSVLLPSFMLSELKVAFIIGFQVYLPFLIIDMVVASVLISMGMMMLPPVLISLPFKLLLFVLIDGWYLTVGMLLEGVQPV